MEINKEKQIVLIAYETSYFFLADDSSDNHFSMVGILVGSIYWPEVKFFEPC